VAFRAHVLVVTRRTLDGFMSRLPIYSRLSWPSSGSRPSVSRRRPARRAPRPASSRTAP
jgi:hypothetical protein